MFLGMWCGAGGDGSDIREFPWCCCCHSLSGSATNRLCAGQHRLASVRQRTDDLPPFRQSSSRLLWADLTKHRSETKHRPLCKEYAMKDIPSTGFGLPDQTVGSIKFEIRKGQSPGRLLRPEFSIRFRATFFDPAFRGEDASIERLEEIAWEAYSDGRKAPFTQKAGPGYADPDYKLSCEWMATKQRLDEAQKRWSEPSTPSRVLLVCGSARNDGTCPGEISKSFRLLQISREVIEQADIVVDVLDLSLLTADYARHIHPCKGCVSTAMPLCHWPCSCYPNHALGQTHDWMAEIYERWAAAHAVLIVSPVYWYQSPSPLKLMIDRLVCADA